MVTGCYFKKKFVRTGEVPIIIITANDFGIGYHPWTGGRANASYLVKPFGLMILRARVAVQLRQITPQRKFVIDHLVFDFEAMVFCVF